MFWTALVFAVCFPYSDPVMVITEYAPYGDLLGFLRKSRGLHDTYYDDPDIKPLSSLNTKQLFGFASDIANGMKFLSSKKVGSICCFEVSWADKRLYSVVWTPLFRPQNNLKAVNNFSYLVGTLCASNEHQRAWDSPHSSHHNPEFHNISRSLKLRMPFPNMHLVIKVVV